MSGLSISDFCSINKISTSSFYLHKQKYAAKNSFVEATVVRHFSKQITGISSSRQTITLATSAGELSFPESISSYFLVSVIKDLL
ncbi:MAG: hypothetical protein ACI9DQ_000479 [Glaciecola sp.]|jgi:hypothetical protein